MLLNNFLCFKSNYPLSIYRANFKLFFRKIADQKLHKADSAGIRHVTFK